MRVISGRYRGIPLKTIKANSTRPTTDKIKETMFNMLTGYIEGQVLDMFAGSGALGIEALSRGASHCVFIEQQFQSTKMIQDNLDKCRIHQEDYQLVKANAINYLAQLSEQRYQFDMIFLDPPYNKRLLQQSLQKIKDYHLLESQGLIVCEMAQSEIYDYAEYGYAILKSRICGMTKIDILTQI